MKFYDKATRVQLETSNQDVIEQYAKLPERYERMDGKRTKTIEPQEAPETSGAFGHPEEAPRRGRKPAEA